MKKRFVSILLVATSLLSMGSLFGCKQEKSAIEVKEDIVLADFEQWAPDFQLMKVYNEFGRVTRNKDTSFVKSGKYSARLQPVGGKGVTQPTVAFPFSSDLFQFDYRDISDYKEVELSFYNDSDAELPVKVGFAKSMSEEAIVVTMGTEYVLAPRAWTDIKHEVNCSFLSMLAEVDRIEGLYIELPDTGVVYPDEAPSVYLDDIVIRRGEKQSVNPDFNLDTDNETFIEIMDFENEYQRYYSLTDASATQAQVSIVSEDEVGVRASHGEKMMQIKNFNAKDTGEFNVYLRDALMRAAGMTKVPVEKWKEVYFAYDYYADYELMSGKEYISGYKTKSGDASQAPLGFVVYTDNGSDPNEKGWRMCKYGYTDSTGTNVWELQRPKMEAYKWKTWRISLYELAFDRRNATDVEYVLDPGSFKITPPNCNDNVTRDIYLDNFRLELGPVVANGEYITVIFA